MKAAVRCFHHLGRSSEARGRAAAAVSFYPLPDRRTRPSSGTPPPAAPPRAVRRTRLPCALYREPLGRRRRDRSSQWSEQASCHDPCCPYDIGRNGGEFILLF